MATNATPLPEWLTGPRTAWGGETNGLRAGLVWNDSSSKLGVTVLVLTFQTNTAWRYVAPPGKNFLKLELRDAQGVLLAPIKGKELNGDLPRRIRTDDLPHSPSAGIHNAGMIENWLMLPPGLPDRLRDFFLQDVYKIEREGDYTLTVFPALYEFAADRKTVSRIDLLPVTIKLHLAPSEAATKKEK